MKADPMAEESQERYRPVRFITAEIEVRFHQKPLFEKKPPAPDFFIWNEEEFHVCEVLSGWHDFERRGRMASNMKTPHLQEASRRGSWGVGRFYYRVRTEGGRTFDLYYDRSPESAADRKGHWFLWRELERSG